MAELILALDVESRASAVRLIEELPGLRWVKVGPMLYLRTGPDLVRELKDRGLAVFLDFKWHDIPNSVAGAVGAAADLGVDLATVHALGGREMMAAAVAAQGDMRLVAVSVLTSHTAESYRQAVGKDGGVTLDDEVVRLGELALGAGVRGLVCAPQEIARVRGRFGPDPWVVVPGIRFQEARADDQRRVAEPGGAVRAGATHLVVGRAITGAPNRRAAYEAICAELV